MKKIICLVFIALMVASVAFAAETITEKNVASLKGTWEGMVDFGITSVSGLKNSPVKVEILNDKFPLQGRMYITDVPEPVAVLMGVGSPGPKITLESDEGKLTTKGTVRWVGTDRRDFVDIALAGPGKLKLTYNAMQVSGDAILKKK
jgi:hypothetical protein